MDAALRWHVVSRKGAKEQRRKGSLTDCTDLHGLFSLCLVPCTLCLAPCVLYLVFYFLDFVFWVLAFYYLIVSRSQLRIISAMLLCATVSRNKINCSSVNFSFCCLKAFQSLGTNCFPPASYISPADLCQRL